MSQEKVMMKGTVSVGRTVKVGNFESYRLDLSEEFDLSESSFESKIQALDAKVEKELRDKGYLK